MGTIELRFDAAIFSADVVVRTTYRYSGDFYTSVEHEATTFVVRLAPRSSTVNLALLEERFRTDALDERMREQIREETGEVHAALVTAALREAVPADDAGPTP
ncbi:His-Xaa-Ser system protein HxsD [Dokdonella immobilis]|uniref:His-Xaa-Ser system protein HxsD n=2 Tax=Dokdonella immobilis TaxID=578942 RepID=A0A1I4WAJ1_9GAMM|nr:His-Xaa-Ser system protein HxsD [Dokdonella immobilis]